MKTRLVILAVLFAFACNSANAQFLNLADNNQRITFGVQLGEAGWQTNYPGFGWGISASICGVYLDFLLSPPQHKNDHHVNQSRPLDDEAFAINVGYQIPLFSWLRIAPIVGYSQTNYGYTDMSSVHIHVDEGSHSGSIYHDYFPQERFHDFNFGGGPPRCLWRHQLQPDSPERETWLRKISDTPCRSHQPRRPAGLFLWVHPIFFWLIQKIVVILQSQTSRSPQG